MRLRFYRVRFEATYPKDNDCYVIVDDEERFVSSWDDFHSDCNLFKQLKKIIGDNCATFEFNAYSLNIEEHIQIIARECVRNNITFKLYFVGADTLNK